MEIAHRKQLPIPITNPRRPSLRARLLDLILYPILYPPLFLLRHLYKPCFGWLDRRMARENQRRFAEEIRTHLAFLFTENAATFIANEGVPFPPPMGGAFVTVAVGVVRLRFLRGCGDFSVEVSSEFAPQHWEDFFLVTDGVAEWDTDRRRSYSYSLRTFGSVLRPRLDHLQDAFSREHHETTLSNAVKIHNEAVDAYAARLRQSGIVPIIS